jgi:glycine hydroxymethyltransferase
MEADMDEIADCIDSVLGAIGGSNETATLETVKKRVAALTARYPLPYKL